MITRTKARLLRSVGLAAAGLVATAAAAQSQRGNHEFDPTLPLRPAASFEGGVVVRAKAGAPTNVVLGARTWIIANRQRIAKFPERGLLVIHVRAGSLVSVIDGKREKRGPDEFWTVPPGADLAIETHQDSVILQVISLRAAGLRR